MSFIMNESGKTYAPGYFLAHEECRRETREIAQASATTAANGGKYVKAGTFYPANNSGTVEGIVYEDVDVSSGNMMGSVVTQGVVYLDRLPASPESGVQSALEGLGFTFITAAPVPTRPTDVPIDGSLGTITVQSAAGTASGDTKITVTYSAKPADAVYYYKVDTAAPTVTYGEVLDSTWTSWNGTSDITAASNKKITIVAAVGGAAIASGNATVTAKT